MKTCEIWKSIIEFRIALLCCINQSINRVMEPWCPSVHRARLPSSNCLCSSRRHIRVLQQAQRKWRLTGMNDEGRVERFAELAAESVEVTEVSFGGHPVEGQRTKGPEKKSQILLATRSWFLLFRPYSLIKREHYLLSKNSRKKGYNHINLIPKLQNKYKETPVLSGNCLLVRSSISPTNAHLSDLPSESLSAPSYFSNPTLTWTTRKWMYISVRVVGNSPSAFKTDSKT